MGLIKNYTEFILESKQAGILYHFTSIDNLFLILKSNFLKGRSRIYTRNATFSGKMQGSTGVSLTRNKHIEAYHVNTECAIVLDGDKLSNNHKVFPYDDFPDHGSKSDLKKPLNKKEFEERVIGNISNIKKYIKHVILFDNVDLESVYYKNFKINNKLNKKYIEENKLTIDQINDLIADELSKYNILTKVESKKRLVNNVECFECNDKPTPCYNCQTYKIDKQEDCLNCEGTGIVSCSHCEKTYYD